MESVLQQTILGFGTIEAYRFFTVFMTWGGLMAE